MSLYLETELYLSVKQQSGVVGQRGPIVLKCRKTNLVEKCVAISQNLIVTLVSADDEMGVENTVVVDSGNLLSIGLWRADTSGDKEDVCVHRVSPASLTVNDEMAVLYSKHGHRLLVDRRAGVVTRAEFEPEIGVSSGLQVPQGSQIDIQLLKRDRVFDMNSHSARSIIILIGRSIDSGSDDSHVVFIPIRRLRDELLVDEVILSQPYELILEVPAVRNIVRIPFPQLNYSASDDFVHILGCGTQSLIMESEVIFSQKYVITGREEQTLARGVILLAYLEMTDDFVNELLAS